jgi:hypothetical protein
MDSMRTGQQPIKPHDCTTRIKKEHKKMNVHGKLKQKQQPNRPESLRPCPNRIRFDSREKGADEGARELFTFMLFRRMFCVKRNGWILQIPAVAAIIAQKGQSSFESFKRFTNRIHHEYGTELSECTIPFEGYLWIVSHLAQIPRIVLSG